MTEPVYKLKEYPGLWRVNGYSNLELPDKSVPKVWVCLSQLKEEQIRTPLTLGSVTGQSIKIKQPLSRISDLLIGSCWRGGGEKGTCANILPPLNKEFVIDTSKIKIVRLGESVSIYGNTYQCVLPKMAIELGKHLYDLAQTLFAVVPVLHDEFTKFLVVPCYELYRFYIGVSSRFINGNVAGSLDRYFEWHNPYLKVLKNLSMLEKFVAYRGHWSSEGRSWFNMPHRHIQSIGQANRLSNGNQPLVMMATFPFCGITTLTIAGKPFKLSNNNSDEWGVFAANILQCSKRESFEVLALGDSESDTPEPGSVDTARPPNGSGPFDDEEDWPETNEQPNTRGSDIAILAQNNRFSAMQGMAFKNFTTNDNEDPVYKNGFSKKAEKVSHDELTGPSDEDDPILPKENFDGHADHVDRDLTDFVHVIIALRHLVSKRGWEVRTRSHGTNLIVEGETVTTFIVPANNKRKLNWRLIGEGENVRPRQIVWVEIAVTPEQFIYLAEMELKGSESGRSTLCVLSKTGRIMDIPDFKVLLKLTATRNGWPQEKHTWKSEQLAKIANEYFQKYEHKGLSHHPSNTAKEQSQKILEWAESIEKKLLKVLNM
ncbi:hypothetical protein PRUB_a1529 [Pseudoalteromonas rubra]|uniref:TnsE C-terminal domain-containing protein n=1 Tax=Pseudoalteromonas rubra TaxID=43658 RepID=A0A8T0CDC0_9GAMM|nr:hypothetical protein [Pseudoalteromonas rubra]KAF7788540.1 hypothetical protein PRUB_a1529 [Pseudoalteromonas rubra]